jgi:lipopolysaccharide cholinephosphotransferase
MNDNHLDDAHKIMLEILVAFDQICQKNRLTYWLDHVTLLGAVRHKGFIPWDDDLDVTMPREDYERFLQIAPRELGGDLFLQTRETDKDYLNFFAKIRHRGSTFIDAWEAKRNIRYHQGIYIDIFPLNTIADTFWCVRTYHALVSVSKLLHNRYIKLPRWTSLWVRLINRFHRRGAPFVVSGGENMHYVIHIDRKYIFPLQKIEFEGSLFPAPKDPKTYLTEIFGPNYMELPPETARKVHSVSIEPNTKCAYEKRVEKHNED